MCCNEISAPTEPRTSSRQLPTRFVHDADHSMRQPGRTRRTNWRLLEHQYSVIVVFCYFRYAVLCVFFVNFAACRLASIVDHGVCGCCQNITVICIRCLC